MKTIFHHRILAILCLLLSITLSNTLILTSVCLATSATSPFTFSTAWWVWDAVGICLILFLHIHYSYVVLVWTLTRHPGIRHGLQIQVHSVLSGGYQ